MTTFSIATRVSCTSMMAVAVLASPDPARAQADVPCAVVYKTLRTTDPSVRELRVMSDDATVSLRLDGASTSFTYVVRRLVIGRANPQASIGGPRYGSDLVAIALPANAGIVDAEVGLLDVATSAPLTCRPTHIGRGLDDADVAPIAAPDAGSVLQPAVATVPPLACDRPFRYVRTLAVAQPQVPPGASVPGQGGIAKILVTVGIDGRSSGSSVVQSSGYPLLDASAQAAAVWTTYAPALFRCTPTIGTYVFSANFAP